MKPLSDDSAFMKCPRLTTGSPPFDADSGLGVRVTKGFLEVAQIYSSLKDVG